MQTLNEYSRNTAGKIEEKDLDPSQHDIPPVKIRFDLNDQIDEHQSSKDKKEYHIRFAMVGSFAKYAKNEDMGQICHRSAGHDRNKKLFHFNPPRIFFKFLI